MNQKEYLRITREEAKELLPIVKALAEGNLIQDEMEELADLCDTDEINFDFNGQKMKFHIKQEPKFRSFETKEECWDEMLKHQPFGWLKSKESGSFSCIGDVLWSEVLKKVIITFSTNESLPLRSDYVFNGYTFADGTPFGVKE